MEERYYDQGKEIINGHIELIYLSPLYSLFVYASYTFFGNLFIASSMIFIIGSTFVSLFGYLICKNLFSKKAAIVFLILTLFFPNATVSVAGYSHSVVFAAALEFGAIYYLILFFKKLKKRFLCYGLVFTLLAIFTRPEILLALVPLFSICIIYKIKKSKKFTQYIIISSILFYTVIGISLMAHKKFIHSNSSNKEMAGIFGDKSYSYFTFIHTYSLRQFNSIKNDDAIVASAPFIGSPEENEYSIFKAVLKNPSQFISNSLYNIKEILDNMAHPLFIPFYFYILLGVLIIKRQSLYTYQSIIILSSLFLLHLTPLIIFHVEIRYMQQLSIIFLLLMSWGASQIKKERLKQILYIYSILTFLIFATYLIYYRNLPSLCG